MHELCLHKLQTGGLHYQITKVQIGAACSTQ